jgi:hypothetical protein
MSESKVSNPSKPSDFDSANTVKATNFGPHGKSGFFFQKGFLS